MYIDKFKDEEGDYVCDGISYGNNPIDFIHIGLLNFCGCGSPKENLRYVANILEHIKNGSTDDYSYDKWVEKGKKLGNEESLYFAYYVFDEKGLTEHGSTVPGWLTEHGENLLADIKEILKI